MNQKIKFPRSEKVYLPGTLNSIFFKAVFLQIDSLSCFSESFLYVCH